jgi:hypothetical protein
VAQLFSLGGITNMKIIPCIFLICLLITTNGCMTMTTVGNAKGITHQNEKGDVVVDEKPKPGYYALIPFAVAGDIVTSPIQLIMVLMMRG